MTDADHAIAPPDEKVDPGEVPVCDFAGGINGPPTDGKLLLAFTAPDGSTVAIRMAEDTWREMAQNVEAVGVSEA